MVEPLVDYGDDGEPEKIIPRSSLKIERPETNYVVKEFAFVNGILGVSLLFWNSLSGEEKKQWVLHAEAVAKKELSL